MTTDRNGTIEGGRGHTTTQLLEQVAAKIARDDRPQDIKTVIETYKDRLQATWVDEQSYPISTYSATRATDRHRFSLGVVYHATPDNPISVMYLVREGGEWKNQNTSGEYEDIAEAKLRVEREIGETLLTMLNADGRNT